MGNQTISFSVPFTDGEEIKKQVSAAVRQYNFYDDKRCSRGKALAYLVNLGFKKFMELLDEKEKELIARKVRVEEIIE